MSTVIDNNRKTAHSDSLQFNHGGIILAQARDGIFQGGHQNRKRKMAVCFIREEQQRALDNASAKKFKEYEAEHVNSGMVLMQGCG